MEETIPQQIRVRLATVGVRPEEVRHAVHSDLGANGHFESQWAVATDTTLHLVNAARVDSYPLADLGEMQVQALVTGGLLMIRPAGSGTEDPASPRDPADGADLERLLLRFTNSEAQRFETFARAVAALQKGEQAPAAEAERERNCPRCGLRYPDQNRSVCPRCIDKRGLFLRVLGYLHPYRGWVALIAAA